jgi:plastocyanin domain-containing protein
MKTLRPAVLHKPLAALLAAPLAALLAAPLARAADKAPAKPPRAIELTLTDAGLAPAEVKVVKGEPVRLAVTRKTDRTCMMDVVIQEVGVKQPLPLGKTVVVEFTPAKSGTFRVLCGMGMEFGKLVVN